MSYTRLKLTEGVYLNVINTNKFKNNYFAVSFLQPLRRSTASLNALVPLILTRGTKRHPTMEAMSIALDEVYASTINTRCFKKGEVQFIGFNCGILDNSYAVDDCDIFARTLEILHDVIFEPYTVDGKFSEKYLVTEKKNLCDRIASQINNKTSYAISRCNSEMCRNENYGISALGEIEDVESIDVDALWEQYNYLINESNVEIFYEGPYDSFVEETIKSALNFSPRKSCQLNTEVIRSAEKVHEVYETQPVTQAKLTLGFRTGKVLSDGDYYKFVLFNELFGGSPTSKLFMNVREKLSLCYYCKSIPEPQKGVMLVTAGIESSKKNKTIDEILHQLNEMRDANITDDEFNSAVSSILNAYREIYDNPESMENWYMGRMLAGINTSPKETAEQLKSVTVSDISEIGKSITLDTIYLMKPEEEEVCYEV